MKPATIIMDEDFRIGEVDPRLYGSVVEHLVLEHEDPKAGNTVESPHEVAPRYGGDATVRDGRLTALPPKLSWNVIRLARQAG